MMTVEQIGLLVSGKYFLEDIYGYERDKYI